MNIISKIKKNILYFFLALPLILIGYETFMTLALGSRTWSFLLVGQIAIVPLVATLFYYIYNVFGEQSYGMSLLFFVISCFSLFILAYLTVNPSSLNLNISSAGIPSLQIPSIELPSIKAPTKEEIDSGFIIFGKVAIPIIVVLSVALLVFPEQFVGLFNGTSRTITTTIINALKFPFTTFLNMFNNNEPIQSNDNCSIFPGISDITSKVPSFYLAHIAFFVGYVFTNALSIYNMSNNGNDEEKGYNSRRYRSLVSMVSISILYFLLVLYRYNVTGCESLLGVFFTSTTFIIVGLSWYLFAKYCGCRAADLSGITTSLVPQKAKSPVVCLNPAAATP
jgi:hypothetical protein